MNTINWLKDNFKSFIENLAVQIIATSLITLGTIIYYKDKFIVLVTSSVKIWQVLILFFVILILIYIYKFRKSKYVQNFSKYGVKWEAIIKKDNEILVKGPFCPRCEEKITGSNPFQCLNCNKQYTALNSTSIEEAQRIVKNRIEAELRGGKLLILDWSSSSYPYSFLHLKNTAASDAKDVLIKIKMEIDKKRRDIGIYKFEKITPDTIITEYTNDPKLDPMKKVHDIFNDLNLISINSLEMEYGDENEIPDLEWIEIKKEFSCNLEVNLSYLLGNKKRIEQSKYFLEFKFRESDEYEDNCEIHMRQLLQDE